MTLYEKVTFLREKKGLSQSELERQSGLSKGTITNWKKRKPNMNSLEKICSTLHCEISYLLEEESENGESYYLNAETKEIAQEIFENKDMRMLFDVARNTKPEHLRAYTDFLKRLQDKEEGNEG